MDGFEGNAQTFRILTVLEGARPDSLRSADEDTGLGMSALARCSVLKYPWMRKDVPATRKDQWTKFCVYVSEANVFSNARSSMGFEPTNQAQSLEASIMDLADDIAYSFHDLEDFIRVGVLNGHAVVRALDEWKEKCDNDVKQLEEDVRCFRECLGIISTSSSQEERKAAQNKLDDFLGRNLSNPFWKAIFSLARIPHFNTGDWHEATRIVLDQMKALVGKTTSVFDMRWLINQWQERVLDKVIYKEDGVSLEKLQWHQVEIYKLVTQHFVHVNPRVTLIQRAQRQSIQTLFDGLVQWCNEEVHINELPWRLRDMLKNDRLGPRTVPLPAVSLGSSEPKSLDPGKEQYRTLRCISDYICSLTDYECQQRSAWLRGLEVPGISHTLP